MAMCEEKKTKRHQEDLQRLASFRPFDDTFMRAMFKENIPLAEMVLRIILDKDDLVLTHCNTQADMKRVTGARSLCFDAYGTDSEGKKYDIEVQRGDEGAGARRARYHASVMDIENLDAGENFDSLPDTYVIFIMENDIFGRGRAVYKIRRRFEDEDIEFNDGNYIIFVNGAYRGDDPLGKLMHDFSCTDADDMNYPLMASRARYLKVNPKGVAEMCKQMEDLRKQSAMESKKEMAVALHGMGVDIEKIAQAAKVSVAQVSAWLTEIE